ncbi:MAG: hypothetical protein KC503_37630 [Myxococcales bacterium]|nr:hypothetical protein [Myxococcales bacterium]
MNERLVLRIQDLAGRDDWSDIKKASAAVIDVDGQSHQLQLVGHETQVGVFRYLECPSCGRRCRHLYQRDKEIGCRICLRIRHPNQRLSSSRWSREVVLPARQLAAVIAELEHEGLDTNHRRRLRRRKNKLIDRIQQELRRRKARFEMLLMRLDKQKLNQKEEPHG